MDERLVSVIIPVYNVEDYIDECMNSLVNQTYKSLEFILINDGSTDGSFEKCLEWEKRDERIRVIDQENRGVSRARNLGINLSTGSFISFVDPDDWVDERYFEKLMGALLENDADFAECDIMRYDNRTGKAIYRSCGEKMGVPFTLTEHMKYGPTATYKAVSKKSLWADNGIRMPSCSFESPAVYSLILALAGKLVNVPEALYWYRRFRENSLIETGYGKEGKSDPRLGIDAMHFLVGEFKRLGLFDEFKDTLEGVVKYRLTDILAMQYHRRSGEEFSALYDSYLEYIDEEFPGTLNFRYVTVGGYNLNKVLSHMNLVQNPADRFNFSSLISVLSGEPGRTKVTHPNRYRKMMIERELSGKLSDSLRNPEYKVIFMDLIEERFDVLKTETGYVTLSDALSGTGEKFTGRVVKRESDECGKLFEEAFERVLEIKNEDTGLIVVENFLSEEVGNINEKKKFENISEIRKTNKILEGYYGYIKRNHPEVKVVKVNDLPLYFTDEKYEYGAVPSHLNEVVNREIAARIESALGE